MMQAVTIKLIISYLAFFLLPIFHDNVNAISCIFNKQRSPDCALFCCKARRKRLEHERSRGKHELQASVFPYFLSALAAS